MERRTLLTKGPAIAALPALAAVTPRFLFAAQPNSTGHLSPAVLTAVTAHIVQTGVKAYNRQLTQGDLRSSIEMVSLLRTHFTEVGADASFQHLGRSYDPAQLSVSPDSELVRNTHNRLTAAGSSISLGEVSNLFSQMVTPSQLQTLGREGITPSLKRLENDWSTHVGKLPVSLDPSHNPAHIQNANICETIMFGTGALGTAAFSLSLGCLPEPFFVVICPAVATLGIIAGVGGIIAWIFC